MSAAPLKMDATLKPNNKRKNQKLVFGFEECGNFTYNATTESQNTDKTKNKAGCNRTPRANIGSIVLQTNNDSCAYYWAKNSSHTTQQSHQHHFTRHMPVNIS